MATNKKYLVTPALPYANGAIHLGHLVEHVQVNIFVRALRMAGKDVLCVCGADSHGTPIEMNALKSNTPPEEFVQKWRLAQEHSFKLYGIEFDGGYGSTHTKENEMFAGKVFSKLQDGGHIVKNEIEQLFDEKLNRFLPDRMVKGTCPFCNAQDQYGDACEACGRTYSPAELKSPKSSLSGTTPVYKKSTHYFVKLRDFEEPLKRWLKTDNHVHPDIQAFLEHWFKEGLKMWDISRDGPYFGFRIPGESDKYFYVWLDAPIGYISLTEIAASLKGLNAASYWEDKNTEIIHFIGKDIVYFHTLFWPAMLMASGYTLPSKIVVHGMLTVDGEKMSKSRGTFILADTFAKHCDTEALRYYFASKLSNRSEDIDLNLNDMVQKVNADIVNKVVNLLSRAIPLLHRSFDGVMGDLDPNASALLEKVRDTVDEAQKHYLDNEPAKAIFSIVRLAEEANKYLQDEEPWKKIALDPEKAHQILTTGVHLGKVCLGLLKPVLPAMTAKLEGILLLKKEIDFDNVAEQLPKGHKLNQFDHLCKRLDEKIVEAIKGDSTTMETSSEKPPAVPPVTTNFITIDQFAAVDLRAAKVLAASTVEGADKLIACQLDVGALGKRQVFSGLRPHVEPDALVGKTVVLVANLAPRKMRFGMSEGMILAVGDNPPRPILLSDAVQPGDKIS